MKTAQWKFALEVTIVAFICLVAVMLVFDVTPGSNPASAGAGVELKAWTAQDQDDADSAIRVAGSRAVRIDSKELETVTEVLEKEAGDRIKAACPDSDCVAPVSVARTLNR
jgi:hypothetical protein